jgi:hypothetical protein
VLYKYVREMASCENTNPKYFFNRAVRSKDRKTPIGHVANETDELVIIYSDSNIRVRFDVPKSQVIEARDCLVIEPTVDLSKYRNDRDAPFRYDVKLKAN